MKKIISLLALYLWAATAHVSAAEPLTLAVHPYLSEEELKVMFTPLAKYLEKQTGLAFSVKIGSTYDEHIDFIGRDRVDIAYIGPAPYVTMTERYGNKKMLARLEVNGQPYFQGNIIVRSNSELRQLTDLRGMRIAFGDPNSTMGFLVPHHMLHKSGVFDEDTEKHQFLNNHNNVALAVLAGEYDAGAVKPAVYEKFKKEGLRTIATTPAISEHLFVASNKLDAAHVEAIREALLTARNSSQGMDALHSIKKNITALVPVQDSDYANLRQIMTESGKLR